jgi:predicted dehydrogenase
MDPLRVAVIGAGYWGPNLVRNFQANAGCDLLWVCDLDEQRARRAVGRYSTVKVTTSPDDVIGDGEVEAVAIATPADTHRTLAGAALEAGKHVMVEKPLASTVAEGEAIVRLAAERGLTLMSDHTYCYTPAVQRIRDLVATGTLGDLQYFDSVRINLGLVQRDIDVFWDLAPHDLSILDFILPEQWAPVGVAAQGADPIGAGHACVGYLTLPLKRGAIAHIHVNWLSPTKIRTFVVGGSRRTLVWDDLNPSQRITIYDRGVDVQEPNGSDARAAAMISYRSGDMLAPALPEGEALRSVVDEFAGAVREGRPALTDGAAGLRVLDVLEAASRSLEFKGAIVPLRAAR